MAPDPDLGPDPANCVGCHFGVCERVGGSAQHHPDVVSTPRCLGCGKSPDKLLEYRICASNLEPPITPDEYVRTEEGTYGIKGPGTFYCTVCYVVAGMSLNHARMR